MTNGGKNKRGQPGWRGSVEGFGGIAQLGPTGLHFPHCAATPPRHGRGFQMARSALYCGMPRKIVLASASPRRRDLLQQHGFAVEMVPSHAKESLPEFLTVAEATLLNAKTKAARVARKRPDALVVAADTLVALDGEALGKPADMDEAFAMLKRLSGRTHIVFSGVWLADGPTGRQLGFIAASRVKFRRMKPAEIREYIKRVDPLDKAGAYAAQRNEMNLIESVEGSYTNVIGLPMEPLAEALREF